MSGRRPRTGVTGVRSGNATALPRRGGPVTAGGGAGSAHRAQLPRRPRHPTAQVAGHQGEADPQAVLRELRERYGDGRQAEIDGLSVDYDDWHFNVRPSNTEPLLRLNLEALDEETMERRREEVLDLIRS